jgi:hypothetical protein
VKKRYRVYPWESFEKDGRWGYRPNPKFIIFWHDTHGLPYETIKELYEKYTPKTKEEDIKIWWNVMNREHSELIKKWREGLNV